jgi:hypothetical protein
VLLPAGYQAKHEHFSNSRFHLRFRNSAHHVSLYQTNLVGMNETDAIAAITTVTSDPSIQDAFNIGLAFGVTVMVGCLGFAMFRTMYDDGNEEL